MYKRCVLAHSAQRQRELEKSLLEIMQTQRYEDITIVELCSYLGIPRKAFYRYFSSKDGALHALIDHTLMDFSGDFFTGTAQATYETLERFFGFWIGQQPLLNVLARNELSGLLVQRAILLATSEDLFPSRLVPERSRYVREHVTLFVVSGLLAMVTQWHKSHFQSTPQQMARIAAHLLTTPLFSSPKRFT